MPPRLPAPLHRGHNRMYQTSPHLLLPLAMVALIPGSFLSAVCKVRARAVNSVILVISRLKDQQYVYMLCWLETHILSASSQGSKSFLHTNRQRSGSNSSASSRTSQSSQDVELQLTQDFGGEMRANSPVNDGLSQPTFAIYVS